MLAWSATGDIRNSRAAVSSSSFGSEIVVVWLNSFFGCSVLLLCDYEHCRAINDWLDAYSIVLLCFVLVIRKNVMCWVSPLDIHFHGVTGARHARLTQFKKVHVSATGLSPHMDDC